MFGTFSLTTPDINKLLPPKSSSIKIRFENTWVDIVSTIVLGFAATVTRKSLVIEICNTPEQVKTYTEAEMQFEIEKIRTELENKHFIEKEELILESQFKEIE